MAILQKYKRYNFFCLFMNIHQPLTLSSEGQPDLTLLLRRLSKLGSCSTHRLPESISHRLCRRKDDCNVHKGESRGGLTAWQTTPRYAQEIERQGGVHDTHAPVTVTKNVRARHTPLCLIAVTMTSFVHTI